MFEIVTDALRGYLIYQEGADRPADSGELCQPGGRFPGPDGPERCRGLPISYSPGNLKKIVSHESKGYNELSLPALKMTALSAQSASSQ
jgi:hypothetical protein